MATAPGWRGGGMCQKRACCLPGPCWVLSCGLRDSRSTEVRGPREDHIGTLSGLALAHSFPSAWRAPVTALVQLSPTCPQGLEQVALRSGSPWLLQD